MTNQTWSRGLAVYRVVSGTGRLFGRKKEAEALVEKLRAAMRRRLLDSARTRS